MFKLHKTNAPKTECLEYILVTNSEAISVGELLKLSSGKLTKASGTDTAEFVSVGQCTAGTGNIVPVARIYETDVYETVLSAAGTSLNIGDKVTIDTTGTKATATTESGVFSLTEILGTAVGDKVRGMFRR